MNLQKEFDAQVQTMGNRSANALKLIDALYVNPFIDTTKTAGLLGITFPSANTLLMELEKRGIIKEVTGNKRGKYYAMAKYLDLFMN